MKASSKILYQLFSSYSLTFYSLIIVLQSLIRIVLGFSLFLSLRVRIFLFISIFARVILIKGLPKMIGPLMHVPNFLRL